MKDLNPGELPPSNDGSIAGMFPKVDHDYEPIKNLAYKCLQWEDGEIKGYDSTMFDNLLPILMEPIFMKKKEVSKMLSKYIEMVESGKKLFEEAEIENTKTINYYRDWCEAFKLEKERLEKENSELKEVQKKTSDEVSELIKQEYYKDKTGFIK